MVRHVRYGCGRCDSSKSLRREACCKVADRPSMGRPFDKRQTNAVSARFAHGAGNRMLKSDRACGTVGIKDRHCRQVSGKRDVRRRI